MIRPHYFQPRLLRTYVGNGPSSVRSPCRPQQLVIDGGGQQQQRLKGALAPDEHIQRQQSVSIRNDLHKLEVRVQNITKLDPTTRMQSNQHAPQARSEILKLLTSFLRTYSVEIDGEGEKKSSVPIPSSQHSPTLGQDILEELLSLKYLGTPTTSGHEEDLNTDSDNQMDLHVSHYNHLLSMCDRIAKSQFDTTLQANASSNEISDTSLTIFQHMVRIGVKGNHRTLLLLLSILSRCHRVGTMVGVLKQAREMDIKCSEYTLHVMLNAFISHGMLREALILLKVLTSGSSPSVSVFNMVLKMCRSLPDKAEAHAISQDIFSNMENGKYGVQPNQVTYSSILEIQIQTKNCNGFIKTWNLMKRLDQPIQELGMVSYLKGCMVFQDISVSIPDLRSDISAYGMKETPRILSTLLRLAVSRQNFKWILELLDDIFQLPAALQHVPSWIAIFKALVALHNRRRFLEIYTIFRTVNLDLSENLAITVLDAVRRHADLDTCLEWYGYMKKCGTKPTCVQYGMILRACIKWSRLDLTRELFTEMLSAPVKPDNICFSSLMDAYVMSGDVARFNWVCSEFVRRNYVPDKCVYATVQAAMKMMSGLDNNPLVRQVEMSRLVKFNLPVPPRPRKSLPPWLQQSPNSHHSQPSLPAWPIGGYQSTLKSSHTLNLKPPVQ